MAQHGVDFGLQKAEFLIDIRCGCTAPTQIQQVVGYVERSHDGATFGADHLATLLDLAHLAVEKSGGRHQCFTLAFRAGNHEFLAHNAHRYAVGHGLHLPSFERLQTPNHAFHPCARQPGLFDQAGVLGVETLVFRFKRVVLELQTLAEFD